MNNIAKLQAELTSAEAEIEALRTALFDIRAYALSGKYTIDGEPGAGYVNARDIASRCEEASSNGFAVRTSAYARAVGPQIAYGGCPYIGRTTCSHEPSLRPGGYHCPLCAWDLQSETPWSDTQARADERMYQHYQKECPKGPSAQ